MASTPIVEPLSSATADPDMSHEGGASGGTDESKDIGHGDDMGTIILISQEGDKYEVPKQIKTLSGPIDDLCDEHDDDDDDDIEIPLVTVQSNELKKIIEYCQYMKDNVPTGVSKPLKTNDMSKLVTDWEASFIDMKDDDICDLIIAANTLEITPLINLCSVKLATFAFGKSVEEVREMFNIVNDFTPEEEKYIRESKDWDI